MKLFAKYNRINIAATVVIFLLASVAFFFALRYILIDQVDEFLYGRKFKIEKYIDEHRELPAPVADEDENTIYQKLSAASVYDTAAINTIEIFDTAEQERALRRQIQFTAFVNSEQWLVTVTKSLEDTDDLLLSVIVITVCTLLLILAAIFFINRFLLKKLWQPFYSTVHKVQQYKIGSGEQLQFAKSSIDEFDMMNVALQQAINKAEQDYTLLKEFTENASHEMQTPLAIIRSKLDVLIQDENLSAKQSEAAAEAYNAIQRLTRLNQSLLLLAKIENKQFTETTNINLKEKTGIKLKNFSELLQNRNITVSAKLDDAFISMNEMLADILLSNLLSNAIKHNADGGVVEILLRQGELCISNTGAAQPLDEQKLFTRFYKNNAADENNGLGLSIVKEVCLVSHCSITYEFEKPDRHVFLVRW